MAMRKRGGCTSSNPQILLGADEGGGVLSVEYFRRAAAAAAAGIWDWDAYLAVTTRGEW